MQARTALGAAYRAMKDPLSLERTAAQYDRVLQHVPDHLPAMTGLAAVLLCRYVNTVIAPGMTLSDPNNASTATR